MNTNIITTVAGGGVGSGEGINALVASVSCAADGGIVVHPNGTIFYTVNSQVKQVQNGILTSIANVNNAWGNDNDGGLASSARFQEPRGVAIDVERNLLYVSDQSTRRIRQINLATRIVTHRLTCTGVVTMLSYDSTTKELFYSDNTYILALNTSTTSTVRTVAGNGAIGEVYEGFPATTQPLDNPKQHTFDKMNNIMYFADTVNGSIYFYNRSDALLYTVKTGFSSPTALAYHSESRRLFVGANDLLHIVNIVCKAGAYGTYPNCLPCPLGSYSAINATSCTPCPIGRFSTTPLASSIAMCQPCPKGTYSATLGANSASYCLPCPMYV